MFRRLRVQFILGSSFAILVILIFMTALINTSRQIQNRREIDRILRFLSDNDGKLDKPNDLPSQLGGPFSTDTLRYYSVVVDQDQQLVYANTSNISEISEDEAFNFAIELIRGSKDKRGDFDQEMTTYSYQVTPYGQGQFLVVFLDTTNYRVTSEALWNVTLVISLVVFVIFFIIVSTISGIVIRPFVRNYDKQRRFITNASHELKTPLAIISANTELQELMTGETEWTKSTNAQVARLTELINNLVVLSRLEEQPELVLREVDLSNIAETVAEDFKGPILRDGKDFTKHIIPDIKVKAEEKSLFELVTLLMDNANKYCDPGGKVSISLRQIGPTKKRARLEISNTYKEGKGKDYSKFFERFYRDDESHNQKETNGYGIGLSMAESTVKLFKGKLLTSYKEDTIIFTVVL